MTFRAISVSASKVFWMFSGEPDELAMVGEPVELLVEDYESNEPLQTRGWTYAIEQDKVWYTTVDSGKLRNSYPLHMLSIE